VVDGGLRLSGKRMVLYVLPCEQGIRVGFVCGRSVGGAVARNRARRRLKEGWRELAPRLRGGRDVVIVARPEMSGAAMGELLAEMERLLLRGDVIT
jgi:ribonuclease P protein component